MFMRIQNVVNNFFLKMYISKKKWKKQQYFIQIVYKILQFFNLKGNWIIFKEHGRIKWRNCLNFTI